MRFVTENQLQVLKSPWRSTYWRVQIKDSGDKWRDWTALGRDDVDHVSAISVRDSIDQPGISGTVSLHYRRFDDNASPYVSEGRLVGYLDVWREIKIDIAVVPIGDIPGEADWVELAYGRIDDLDVSSNPATLQFRDKLVAENMDAYIEEIRVEGGGAPVDEVIDDLLSSWGTETVVVEGSLPSFGVRDYKQQKMPVLDACMRISQQIGWDLRSRWSDVGEDWDLVLSQPNRGSPTSGMTLPVELYTTYTRASNPVANVRNVVKVFYGAVGSPDNLGNPGRSVVTRTDVTSIARYGRRFMELAESASSLIANQAQAEDLADFAIEDLAEPTLLFGVELNTPMWPLEVNDYVTFEPDGQIFDTPTGLAITGWAIDASPQTPPVMRLELRGQPGLGVDRWLRNEARLGKSMPSDDLSPEVPLVTVQAGALGGGISIAYPSGDQDWDQVEIHRSGSAGFDPSSDTLFAVGRVDKFEMVDLDADESQYVKAVLRDKKGNVSTSAQSLLTSQGITREKLARSLREAFAKAVQSANQEFGLASGTVDWASVPIGNTKLFDLPNDQFEPDENGIWYLDLSVALTGTSVSGYVTIEGGVSGEIARSNALSSSSGGTCRIQEYLELNNSEVEAYTAVWNRTAGSGVATDADNTFWALIRTYYKDA